MTDKGAGAPPPIEGGSQNKALETTEKASPKETAETIPPDLRFETPEDVADALRRRCKRAFFKHVSKTGAMEIIEAAQAQGFDPKDFVNIGNENNKTALMFASQLKNAHELVRFLLSHGADPNASTVRGHTAVVFASGKGREGTLRVLFEYGGRVRVRVVRGDTTVSIASPRLSPAMQAELRWREETEEGGWLDFTGDTTAQRAQRLHEQACKHCRVRLGLDPPSPSWRKRRQRGQEDLFAPLALEDLSAAISNAFQKDSSKYGVEGENDNNEGGRDVHSEKKEEGEQQQGEADDDDDDDDDNDDEEEEGETEGERGMEEVEEDRHKEARDGDNVTAPGNAATDRQHHGSNTGTSGSGDEDVRAKGHSNAKHTNITTTTGSNSRHENSSDDGNENTVQRVRVLVCRCVLTSFSMKPADRKAFAPAFSATMAGITAHLTDEQLLVLLRACNQQAIVSTIKSRSDFPVKRASLTFTHIRKALAHALQQPKTQSRLRPHMLARVSDGTIAYMLLSSLVETCGRTWILHPPCQHANSNATTITEDKGSPNTAASGSFCMCAQDLSTSNIADTSKRPGVRMCAIVAVVRSHLSSLIRVRNLAEVRDSLDCLQALATQEHGHHAAGRQEVEKAQEDETEKQVKAERGDDEGDGNDNSRADVAKQPPQHHQHERTGEATASYSDGEEEDNKNNAITPKDNSSNNNNDDDNSSGSSGGKGCTIKDGESPGELQRSEQQHGACTSQRLVLGLLTWGMCAMAQEGHLPFVETQLKRLQQQQDRQDVLFAALREVLPAVDDVLASMGTISPRTDNSNSNSGSTMNMAQASREHSEGTASSQGQQPPRPPPSQKAQPQAATSSPSSSQPTEQQYRELRCQYSVAAIERVLLSCSVRAPAWATERMELLCLQEIVSQQRLFDAVEYASTSATLRRYLSMCGVTADRAEEEYARMVESISKTCLQLPDRVNLTWVNTPQGLDDLLKCLEQHVLDLETKSEEVLVGVDTEWRQPRPECTVMQLAVDSHAWVVDTLAPSFSQVYRDKLSGLLEFLFKTPKVHVLGFSFKDDVRHITPLCPSLALGAHLAFTDVQALVRRRLKKKAQPSLSRCCELVFGRPLNKIEQCSNWERRPLREDQLSYAAIDAWSLIGIYRHYASP